MQLEQSPQPEISETSSWIVTGSEEILNEIVRIYEGLRKTSSGQKYGLIKYAEMKRTETGLSFTAKPSEMNGVGLQPMTPEEFKRTLLLLKEQGATENWGEEDWEKSIIVASADSTAN